MYSYCIPNTSLLTYSLYNPNFKVVEFDHFKKEAGLPTFTMSVGNWVEKTNAIGIISISGKSLRKLSVPRPHLPPDGPVRNAPSYRYYSYPSEFL